MWRWLALSALSAAMTAVPVWLVWVMATERKAYREAFRFDIAQVADTMPLHRPLSVRALILSGFAALAQRKG